MNKFFPLLLLAFSGAASADPRVYKLDLSYEKLLTNQDPMVPDIPQEAWGDSVSITFGVQAGRFYLDGGPNFQSAYAKVTTVALEFHAGFELFSWLDLDYYHLSRHSSDRKNSYEEQPATPDYLKYGKYPLVNAVGFVIHFIPNTRKQDR